MRFINYNNHLMPLPFNGAAVKAIVFFFGGPTRCTDMFVWCHMTSYIDRFDRDAV